MYIMKGPCSPGPYQTDLEQALATGAMGRAIDRARADFDMAVRNPAPPPESRDQVRIKTTDQADGAAAEAAGASLGARVVAYPYCEPFRLEQFALGPHEALPPECGSYYRSEFQAPATPIPIAVLEKGPEALPDWPPPKKPSGDICRDLRDSIITQADVTLEQLWKCSQEAPRTGVIGVYASPEAAAAGGAEAGVSGLGELEPGRGGLGAIGWVGLGLLGLIMLGSGKGRR